MTKITKKIVTVPVHVTVKTRTDELMKEINAVNSFVIVENKKGDGVTVVQWKADKWSQQKLARMLVQHASKILCSPMTFTAKK